MSERAVSSMHYVRNRNVYRLRTV